MITSDRKHRTRKHAPSLRQGTPRTWVPARFINGPYEHRRRHARHLLSVQKLTKEGRTLYKHSRPPLTLRLDTRPAPYCILYTISTTVPTCT